MAILSLISGNGELVNSESVSDATVKLVKPSDFAANAVSRGKAESASAAAQLRQVGDNSASVSDAATVKLVKPKIITSELYLFGITIISGLLISKYVI